MGIVKTKRAMLPDKSGIAPIVAGVILLIISAAIGITALAVYQITQRPDIIYNITDTGFSLAGLEMDSLWIIAAVIGGLVLLWLVMRPKRRS